MLLDKLADDFSRNGYSLRHTLRTIARSATYARSADASEENKDDRQFYSHAIRRPLEPAVLADALADVLGISEVYGDQPAGTRAVALVDPTVDSVTLDVLGRCSGDEACEPATNTMGGLPQKLHLLNGKLLNDRIAAEGSRLRRLLKPDSGRMIAEPINLIDDLYVVALSRRPTPAELQYWRSELEKIPAEEMLKFFEDFVWSLLSSQEFSTNH